MNYFRSRDALFNALGARIFGRLTPSAQVLETSAVYPPSRARLTLKASFEADVTFHETAGLAGGRQMVTLLHLAFEGLILNTLTVPGVLEIQPNLDPWIDLLVERLLPEPQA